MVARVRDGNVGELYHRSEWSRLQTRRSRADECEALALLEVIQKVRDILNSQPNGQGLTPAESFERLARIRELVR